MISMRYALVTSIALLVALVPTLIHTYLKLELDNGLSTAIIPDTLSGLETGGYSGP